MADLSNRQLRGDQVVTVHLHRIPGINIAPNITRNMDHLPCEYGAGVTEDSHELEVSFGEGQSSRLHWQPTPTRLNPSFLEFWRLHLLKDTSFTLIAGL